MKAIITETQLTIRDEKGHFILSLKNPAPSRKFGAFWLLNKADALGIELTPEVEATLNEIYKSEPSTEEFKSYLSRIRVVRTVVFE